MDEHDPQLEARAERGGELGRASPSERVGHVADDRPAHQPS
jgi:hypothetical protein